MTPICPHCQSDEDVEILAMKLPQMPEQRALFPARQWWWCRACQVQWELV